MPTDLTLFSAFLIGLLGSTHCIGMCGGIVGALTLGVRGAPMRSPWSLVPYLLAYNTGRIASYAIAGALLGFLSAQVFQFAPTAQARFVARSISGGFMIALGFYLSGWWTGLGALEQLGGKLWMRIEPLGRRLLPVTHPTQALLLGLLWGWLPCGMVYAALAWSLSSGSAAQGAMLMIAFGVGTLPMLLSLGATARWLGDLSRQPWLRRATGALLILFGVYTLFIPGRHDGHGIEHSVNTPALVGTAYFSL
jgi:sulfite exporter TauE/SafE